MMATPVIAVTTQQEDNINDVFAVRPFLCKLWWTLLYRGAVAASDNGCSDWPALQPGERRQDLIHASENHSLCPTSWFCCCCLAAHQKVTNIHLVLGTKTVAMSWHELLGGELAPSEGSLLIRQQSIFDIYVDSPACTMSTYIVTV